MEDANHALTDDPFVSVDYVQKLFGLSRVTVESWLATGELPHYRLGPRTIRIARADLEAFIAERRRTSLLSHAEVQELPDAAEPETGRNKHSAPERPIHESSEAA